MKLFCNKKMKFVKKKNVIEYNSDNWDYMPLYVIKDSFPIYISLDEEHLIELCHSYLKFENFVKHKDKEIVLIEKIKTTLNKEHLINNLKEWSRDSFMFSVYGPVDYFQFSYIPEIKEILENKFNTEFK